MSEQPEQSTAGRPGARRWVRPAVGVALLVALLFLVPLREAVARMRGADMLLLTAAFMVAAGAVVVSALKVWVLVRTRAPGVHFLSVLRAYYVGTFFNSFLPTSVGGDVFKIDQLRRGGVPLGHAAAATVVERFTGVFVVLILALGVGLGWKAFSPSVHLEPFRWPLVLLGGGGIAGLAAGYIGWRGALKPWLKARRERPLCGRVYRVIESFFVFRDQPASALWAMLLSVLFYALLAGNIALVALAVGADVPFLRAVSVVPMIKAPELIPISIGGLGVREGAMTYCLNDAGVTAGQAAAVALLLRFITWVHSAVGGLAYAWARRAGEQA